MASSRRQKAPCFICIVNCFIILLLGLLLQVIHSQDCVNGVYDGECKCNPCWTGEHCDTPASVSPQFTERYKEVYFKTSSEESVYTANAVGPGFKDTCVTEHSDNCPCGKILYSIRSHDREFKMNELTGELRVKPGVVLSEDEYMLEIDAKVQDGKEEKVDTMTLLIHVMKTDPFGQVMDGYPNDEEEHSRQKRATNQVTNVTFVLEKKPPHNDTTEMKIGTKIGFKLTIHFPPGDTDMLVELFTPDNATTVMMLCEVQVNSLAPNTNLAYNGSGHPDFFSLNNSVLYDRAVIDFGVVTNSDADNSEAINNQIIIEYSAVMIHNHDTQNGSTYWVSAGAEYSNDQYVWVGQARFLALLENENITEVPTFNFTGPSSMPIGSAAVFQVDMFIPYPSVSLSFDAFAPINTSNIMSICGVKAKDVGINYNCGFDYKSLKSEAFPDGQTRGNKRAHLEIGTVTNKGVRDTTYVEADSRITVEFAAFVYEDTTTVGDKYWVGAALQIGDDQIWAGQLEVEATAMALSSTVPTFQLTGQSTLSSLIPASLVLTVTVPVHSTYDYKVEVLTPYDNGAVLQLCTLRIQHVGDNFPCLHNDTEAVYSSQDGNTGSAPNRAVLSLGKVTNVGPWGWVDASSSNSNDITFLIMVKATNHSSATVGSQHSISVSVRQGGTSLYQGSHSVTVEAAPALDTDVANESIPEFSLRYAEGQSEYVEVGTATTFVYEMTTKRDVKYPMMNIEFIMPNDTDGNEKSPVTICRTSIKSVGKNIMCLIKPTINKAIVYDSRYKNDFNDRSVLSLGAVCNSELVASNDTTEDKLIIETVIKMEDVTSNNVNGTRLWLSAGTMYSTSRMWVGQLAVYSLTNGVPTTSDKPTIILKNTTQLPEIPVGYTVRYNLTIKSPPAQHIKYVINIKSKDADLGICVFKMVAVGENLPCVNQSTLATFNYDQQLGINTEATIDLGYVSNTGVTPLAKDDMFDDNTMQFELILQVTKQATAAKKSFDVKVTYDTLSVTTTEEITVTTDTSNINKTITKMPTMQFNIGSITEGENISNLIYTGQAKRLLVDIHTPEDTVQDVTVKILAPVNLKGIVEIKYISLQSVGHNMPCLHRKVTIPDYTVINADAGKNEVATLALGFVCNTPLKRDDVDANLIRIQVIVRLLNDDTLTDGQTLTMSAAVNVNDQQISIAQLDLVTTKTFSELRQDNMTLINNTAVKLNITDDPIYMKISEKRVFPVVMYLPVNSTLDVRFDVDLPVNDSAVMTVLSVNVTGSGRNLVGYDTFNHFKVTEKSSQNTTQINKLYCSLGVVTNTGYTYQTGEEVEEDDTVTLDLELQLADSSINTNNSEHWISLGIKVGIYIVILEYKVVVIRDGSEKPQIQFLGSVNDSSTSSTVIIDGVISHANTSTAEGQNVSAILYNPPFMNFSAILSSNDSRISFTESEEGKILYINIEKFFFTDVLGLTLELKTNGEKVPAGYTGNNVVSTLEVVSQMHSYLSTDDFAGDMSDVVYSVFVLPEINFVCVTKVLGLESGAIQDCQLDSSPETISGGEAKYGRLNAAGWKPFVRDGKLKEERYFQVYFGNITLVQKIDLVVSDSTNLITKIKTKYSNDGYAWLDGETITIPTPYSPDSKKHTQMLSNSTPYRYIRIYILDNQSPKDELTVTFELHGCMAGTDISTSDVCTTVVSSPQSAIADFYRRGFVAMPDGGLFICDATIERGLKQVCFYSPDGTSWKELDSRLACVIGHDSENNRVYGIASDGLSFMVSSDNGASWEFCSSDDVTKSKAKPNFLAAKVVPWVDDSKLKLTNPDPAYTAGSWGATADGMKKQSSSVWESKLDWSNCCP